MKILTLLILFTLFANTVFCQNMDLPEWLLSPDYYNNSQYAVGVSDPLADSTMAFEQAFNRALFNYALFHESRYASLTAVANAQQTNFKINNIETLLFSSLLKANFALKDSFKVVHKIYSHYGECFVLLRKTGVFKTKQSQLSFLLIRRIAFYNDDAGMPVSSDEFEIKAFINNQAVEHYKVSRDILSKYSIVSEFRYKNQWKKFSVENRYRTYTDSNFTEQEFYQCAENLNYGFWAAYLYALSDQISIYSALNQNITQGLVSIRQGNMQGQMIASELELLYNTQKIEVRDIDIRLKKIDVSGNKLIVQLAGKKSMQNIDYVQPVLKRKEKKMLKTMQKELWQELNVRDYRQAYYIQKNYQNKDNYLNSEATTKSGNIASGIIQGILTARLGIETQANSKIVSISAIETSAENNSVVRNSKLLSNMNSKNIFPYLFFIKKINTNAYLIHTKLFYKINND
jgi:hypothetical protein